MLAGVLLKMGGYGLIRICVTMFPEVTRDYAWLLVTLAVVSILYGATITLRQTDLKRLEARLKLRQSGKCVVGVQPRKRRAGAPGKEAGHVSMPRTVSPG